MKLTREQADAHLQAGRPVAFVPEQGPVRTLQVPEGGRRAVRTKLPPEDEEGEFLLLRDEKGDLTRAGMEHVLREGGSVLLDGRQIEHLDDLPTEADLARGDERRTAAVREQLDRQMAELAAQRARLDTPEGAIRQPSATPPRTRQPRAPQPPGVFPPASKPAEEKED